jgi:L-malate glycosyltransferase
MLNYEYPPLGGGAANATAHILQQFAGRDDLHVDLVTSSVGAARTERPHENITIHFVAIGKRGSLHHQSLRELLAYTHRGGRLARRLARERDYDVCHAFFGVPCGWMARKLPMPYIVSLRGSDVPYYSARFRWADRLLLRRLSPRIWRRAAAVVANSQGLRRLARQCAPGQLIEVIPNGVDTEMFRPGPRGDGALRVVCAARLIRRKGIGYLIDAVARLSDVDVRLTLVGEGAHEPELRRQVDRLGLVGRVEFAGLVMHERMQEIYSQADVFALPSLNEGMSNTALEALAAGLPLILTDTGGTEELLRNGCNGVLVPMRSSAAICEVLHHYAADADLTARHGAESRHIAESMSWQAVADAYADLYASVADSPGDRA